MKNQTSSLPLLLLGLGLVLLAGNSHAQDDTENCIADLLSNFGGGRSMVPMAMRALESFRRRVGAEKVVERLDYMMRACVCSDSFPNGATDEQLCMCTQEIKDCDIMHKPNSTTPESKIKAKINDWMNCMGDTRLASAMTCKETLLTNPAQMVCEGQQIICPEEE